ANVTGLSPLPAFGELPPAAAGKDPAQTALFDLHLPGPGTGRTELPPSREVAETAAFRLQGLGVLCGQEMRHTNSPAPVGLVRNWFFQRQTQSNGLNFSLHGTQTSYGRGPDLDSARAGLLMEIVERFCAFATVRGDRIPDLSGANRITRAKYSELTKDFHCLNPKELLPDYPYQDEELAWMPAEELTFKGAREILVPVQIVFLFSNLGEKSLFAAPSSTGLAAGTNIKQARLGALMEVLERDALGLGLFQPENCFRLQEDGSPWGRMLAAAIPENTDVIFQDITPDLGIPCYKALVRDGQGDIHFGSGAALDSGRALWNALTEIPLPPGLTPAPVLTAPLEETGVQDLPDYSSGEISRDLETVCSLLIANGYRPIFAHLTRRDLGFPVVRAIVPGLEPSVDFDRYRRLTPRLKQAWEKTEERKLNRKPPGS
ncbi:MAG: YcaO-like family protein, partial [Desulfonatronovibrionaceae bacterium]